MSHTMNIEVEVTDRSALEAACQRAGATLLVGTEHKLFGGIENGIGVQLPGWGFPVVFTPAGQAKYDNYGGRWGGHDKLTNLLACYGCEKAKIEATRNNIWSQTETEDDQFITLTLNLD